MEMNIITEEKNVSIRILQLKNNFYWNSGETEGEALGEYCVLGYFDALDISEADQANVTGFNTWERLGGLTLKQKNALSCRSLVCVTEQQKKDEAFWNDETRVLYFITMVRINKIASAEDKRREIEKNESLSSENHISYLSYDHSEIIVVTKTNTYSEGIRDVKRIREICNAVKTYTVFAVREDALQSYGSIYGKMTQENVCCRLHCMVRDYGKAEKFRKELEAHFSKRNGHSVEIRKFETFGGCDWLMEVDNVSISSVFECYKMGKMLTHSNENYRESFFNVESEILVKEDFARDERDG